MPAQINLLDEIIVDNFAGGGGASTGIELATGCPVTIAINHDPDAILMHRTNHPYTQHYCESVWDIDPRKVCAGRKVGLAWFSPDCKHFSKAKGSKPVEKKIRGLAWIVLKWAGTVRPKVIILENVEEFQTWGPVRKGRPVKSKRGDTFQHWKVQLESLGYQVDHRELKACDYGAPTTRKRFFLVARCDGHPIVWPEPTHGDPKSLEVQSGLLKPWRTAAEVIDWTLPCPSIFDTTEEIKSKYGIRAVRPLSENTMRRIARGIQKFVLDNPEPFIVSIGQTGFSQDRSRSIYSPLNTIVSKAEQCLITPTLIQYHSETAHSEVRGQGLKEPIMTLDASPRYALVSAFVAKHFGGTYSGAGSDLVEPLHTCTAKDHNALVTAFISRQFGTSIGHQIDEPLGTVTSVDKSRLVEAFLIKYYGQGTGQSLHAPLDTIVSKDRFGIVTIEGTKYQIIDIGMRMLEPHELYAAQGFPSDYKISTDYKGKGYSKTKQVARCGNAVPPPFAEALVRANRPDLCGQTINTMAELESRMAT